MLAHFAVMVCAFLFAPAKGQAALDATSATDALDTIDLDALASKYGTDKRRSHHKYTDAYSLLFDHRRGAIRNLTEVGIGGGASMKMWLDYFPRAHIFGTNIDLELRFDPHGTVHEKAGGKRYGIPQISNPRIHMAVCKARTDDECLQTKLGLIEGSMDIVIDDAGSHARRLQEEVIQVMWKYLKVGGVYIIEDIDWNKGGLDYRDNPHAVHPFMRGVLASHKTMFIDAHVGMPESTFQRFVKHSYGWSVNHTAHNSYMMAIKKVR